ncbi:MAG: hypothetical protein KCHDKBKB_00625 [Elusimicrobia bacterium]|nr:hypothetical protein [Elusimicrobiota bacterium]
MTIGYLERMKEQYLNQILYFQCELPIPLEEAKKYVAEKREIIDGFIECIKAQKNWEKIKKEKK